MIDYPIGFEVTKIVQETPTIKTFFLKTPLRSMPGQFVMVWLPGEDEKPFVLSCQGKDDVGITVKKVGDCTKKMFELKEGAVLGLRGPYGHGYEFNVVKKALVVAGGIGAASAVSAIEELAERKCKVTVILGAKTEKELLFRKRIEKIAELHITTDDGSCGEKCFTTDKMEELVRKERFDCVYSCGPEIMMLNVFEICERNRVKCQLSLERFFKCAIGICGQCSIDEWLVCKDGPVFDSEKLRKMQEFGKFARLKSGQKVELHHYHKWRHK